MNRIVALISVIALTLAIATPAFAWSVTVENNCDYDHSVSDFDNLQRFRIYSHRILSHHPEEATAVSPGESKTVNLPGAWCVGSLEDAYGNHHYCFPWIPYIPCCWNVTYEVSDDGTLGNCGKITVK